MNLEQIYIKDINDIDTVFNNKNEIITSITHLNSKGLIKSDIYNIRKRGICFKYSRCENYVCKL